MLRIFKKLYYLFLQGSYTFRLSGVCHLQEESLFFLAADASNIAGIDDDQMWRNFNRNLMLLEPNENIRQSRAVKFVVAELNGLQRSKGIQNSVWKNVLPNSVDPISVQRQIPKISQRDD